jgi:hypothetical protein
MSIGEPLLCSCPVQERHPGRWRTHFLLLLAVIEQSTHQLLRTASSSGDRRRFTTEDNPKLSPFSHLISPHAMFSTGQSIFRIHHYSFHLALMAE